MFIPVGFSTMLLTIGLPVYLSQLEPASFNQTPYYQLYQFSEHGLLLVIFVFNLSIFYFKNPAMRINIFRELKDFCKDIF